MTYQKHTKRHQGKVWFDDMIYIWSQEKPNNMIADITTNTEEEDYLLRMRGVGRGATREEQKNTARRFVECWNACEGIESPLDLRRQRDELREALELADYKILEMLNHGHFDAQALANFRAAHLKIQQTLIKAKEAK